MARVHTSQHISTSASLSMTISGRYSVFITYTSLYWQIMIAFGLKIP